MIPGWKPPKPINYVEVVKFKLQKLLLKLSYPRIMTQRMAVKCLKHGKAKFVIVDRFTMHEWHQHEISFEYRHLHNLS